MKKMTFALAAATLFGGLAFGAGAASAAPMGPNGLQTGSSGITHVRMMHGDRMMMMKKRMMRRHMMKKRMMHRM
jgi:hypothetical protein